LARISYKENGIIEQKGEQHADLCISVWKDGHYLIRHGGEQGQTQFFQGKMSDAQLKELQSILDTADFIALTDARGDLVRKEFVAEVQRAKEVQQLVLVIPDDKQPFPAPAADVINWLLRFHPTDAVRLTNTEYRDICPKILRMLPVAENLGFAIRDSCASTAR
jgi:hypothetical protein